jgi:hypothetical protein
MPFHVLMKQNKIRCNQASASTAAAGALGAPSALRRLSLIETKRWYRWCQSEAEMI